MVVERNHRIMNSLAFPKVRHLGQGHEPSMLWVMMARQSWAVRNKQPHERRIPSITLRHVLQGVVVVVLRVNRRTACP